MTSGLLTLACTSTKLFAVKRIPDSSAKNAPGVKYEIGSLQKKQISYSRHPANGYCGHPADGIWVFPQLFLVKGVPKHRRTNGGGEGGRSPG